MSGPQITQNTQNGQLSRYQRLMQTQAELRKQSETENTAEAEKLEKTGGQISSVSQTAGTTMTAAGEAFEKASSAGGEFGAIAAVLGKVFQIGGKCVEVGGKAAGAATTAAGKAKKGDNVGAAVTAVTGAASSVASGVKAGGEIKEASQDLKVENRLAETDAQITGMESAIEKSGEPATEKDQKKLANLQTYRGKLEHKVELKGQSQENKETMKGLREQMGAAETKDERLVVKKEIQAQQAKVKGQHLDEKKFKKEKIANHQQELKAAREAKKEKLKGEIKNAKAKQKEEEQKERETVGETGETICKTGSSIFSWLGKICPWFYIGTAACEATGAAFHTSKDPNAKAGDYAANIGLKLATGGMAGQDEAKALFKKKPKQA